MILELSDPLVEQLHDTLEAVVTDMSSEITATDNPMYRQGLRDRREKLRDVLSQLDAANQR
ncbi:MAG: hypothetical protein ABSC41_08110 [Acidimicrobiales bacterium]|jgi:hypothetical protein